MCVALAYVIVHSACVNVMPTARTLPLCAVVGTLRLKSNGESKIAISKARLCYDFAIALRALFLGDSMLVDCFGCCLTMTQDYHCAKQAESGVIRVRNKVEQPLARNLRRRGLARGLLAQNNPRLTPRDSRNNLHRLRRVFVDSKLKRARIVLVLHALKQRRIRQERVYLARNAII